MADVAKIIAVYRKLRDEKLALEAAHKKEKGAIQEKMDRLEAWLLAQANEQNVDNFATSAGTAFKNTKTTVSVKDKVQFFAFLVQEGSEEFINATANKTAVLDYMKQHDGQLPPGVACRQEVVIQVNAPRKKTFSADS